MKNKPFRFSSAVGEIWVLATFKVKYCHNIFDNEAVRNLCNVLFNQAFDFYKIRCRKLAFDSDHVHMILEMGLLGKAEIAKRLKGYVAKDLFRLMPWLKDKHFWASGLWNPAYDIRNVGDMAFYERYLDKQKYAGKGQCLLNQF